LTDKKKILIADNDEITLDFFEVMLSKLGFYVEKATDGEDALEKIMNPECSELPRLAVINAVLPGTTGWRILKSVKKDPKTAFMPVLLMSEINSAKEIVEAFDLGADDYIVKPFNFSVLLARIQAALRREEIFSALYAQEELLERTEQFNDGLEQAVIGLKNAAEGFVAGIMNASKENSGISEAASIKDKARLLLDTAHITEKYIERSRSNRESLKKRETVPAILKKIYMVR
jgi:DNA-binding response OmpR family regulator